MKLRAENGQRSYNWLDSKKHSSLFSEAGCQGREARVSWLEDHRSSGP